MDKSVSEKTWACIYWMCVWQFLFDESYWYLVGNLFGPWLGWMVDGPLVYGTCRDTPVGGAGYRGTLGACAGLVTLGYGTGGVTLRDDACIGTVKGARHGALMRVGGSIGGNGNIGRHG